MTLNIADQNSSSETLMIIREIWAEILQFPVNKIGDRDNFFALGGTSIQAFMVNAKIEETFTPRLPSDGIPITAITDTVDLASFSTHLEQIMSQPGETMTMISDDIEEGTI